MFIFFCLFSSQDMVDLSVSVDDQYNVWVTLDLVILVHCLEFVVVAILAGLIALTTGSMRRITEMVSMPTGLVFVLLVIHVVFIIVVRLTLVFVKREKTVAFRVSSVLLVLVIATCLLIGRLYALLCLAPILLFDLMMYVFASIIYVNGEESHIELMKKSNDADIASLYQSLEGFSGRMLNVNAFINRTTTALYQDTQQQCKVGVPGTIKLSEAKQQLHTHVPSSKPNSDWREIIAATSSVGVNGDGYVSVDSLVTHIKDKFFRVGRDGIKLVDVNNGSQPNMVTAEIHGRLYQVAKCEEAYDVLFDDLLQFTTYWDGVRSGNFLQINLYKLSSAIKNVKLVLGRPFIDLDGLLLKMNTWKKEPEDYLAACTPFARSSKDAKCVDIARFVAYIQKDLMITKVKPADIALSLQSLHGGPMPAREPKNLPLLDAFDYGLALKTVAIKSPYHKLVNCAELVRKLDSLSADELVLGPESMFSRLIRDASNDEFGHPVLQVYNAVVSVVLSGYGSITIKEFIKRSLMFVLHNEDVIDNDYVFQKFYTDKAFLKSWVKEVVDVKKT